MYNRGLVGLLLRFNVSSLVVIWILVLAAIIGTFLYFGTKENSKLSDYARKYLWMYIITFIGLSIPIIRALLYKLGIPPMLGILVPLIIFSFVFDNLRRIGRFGNFLYNDGDLLDAPYYRGYDPMSMRSRNNINLALQERENALRYASMFVKPYNDPMGNHTLENKNCILVYICDRGRPSFECLSKNKTGINNFKSFDVVCLRDKNRSDTIFTGILRVYASETNIDTLYSLFKNNPDFKFTKLIEYSNEKKVSYSVNKDNVKDSKNNDSSLLDINTASETELSKLPGINIVLAKKIVSLREERGGFKDVDDFIKTMGMKSHYAKKMKELIKVVKIEKVKKSKQARVLDI